MVRHRAVSPFTMILACLVAISIGSPSAPAWAQSKDQEKCINSANKDGSKVAATQGKANSGCVKDAGNGKLDPSTPTVDACLTADLKGKTQKAKDKVTKTAGDKCSGGANPPFGFSDATTINDSAMNEEVSLTEDIFLDPVDPNIILASVDKDGAKCQASVIKAYEKYASTLVKNVLKCKKDGLKQDSVTNAATLASECMFPSDAKLVDKLGKALAKVQSTIEKKCVGVTLASAFPGECTGATGTAAALSQCLADASDCRTCLYLNAADAIDAGCDGLDDGNATNGTCRECGNTFTEAPEDCDDGGESATCDPDCTTVVCGDGFANNSAGEECDDADANDNDPCPTTCLDAVCGDGFQCTVGPCTSGPGGGNEECDDGGANSDVTPDACRTNCAVAGCGDSVTDTGEDCDDGGESVTCDVDCSSASCGDGTTNATAGEDCDDSGESATCDADCTDAICGDGTTNATAGEDCDDSGESATCDADCSDATCGDGTTNATAGEDCDDSGESATCDADCSDATCGDGTLNTTSGEVCDDGAGNSDVTPDACRTNCMPAGCGDGVTDTGEDCDDSGESATCDADCTVPVCGDGVTNVTAGEDCDDAGESASCDADCSDAICGDGTLNTTSGEVCDDGAGNNDVTPDACRTNCMPAGCGDGVIDSGEFCDDAGESATCDDDCTAVACGDGNTNTSAGEDCDDSGESASCDPDCTDVICGDGFINMTAGEECEDGNVVGGDGCSAMCTCGMGSGEIGCQDAECPGSGEVVLYAGVRTTACASNTDCLVDGALVGTCDTGLGFCVTDTRLDAGYSGQGHNSDITDGVVTRGSLLCPGPFDGLDPEPCGECLVTGYDASTGLCRCNTDLRIQCDDTFDLDFDDCGVPGPSCTIDDDCKVCDGDTATSCSTDDDCSECDTSGGPCGKNSDCPSGETCLLNTKGKCLTGVFLPTCSGGTCVGNCDCFFGPPLALSAGNTPACVINKFAEDISGTANVDLGEAEITAKLAAIVFLGELVTAPCPFCTGDITPLDDVRDGTCVLGPNDGDSCDVQAVSNTFPGPTGDGSSLDCAPAVGKNVSGTGLKLTLVQTTGSTTMRGEVECGFPPFAPEICPCSTCSGDSSLTCRSNADCAGAGDCELVAALVPRANECASSLVTVTSAACSDDGTTSCSTNGDCAACTTNGDCGGIDDGICDGVNCECMPLSAECTTGPIGTFCDGVTRGNGEAYVGCITNADCDNTECGFGVGAGLCGTCTESIKRPSFSEPIVAIGAPDTETPLGVATFCVAQTASPGINTVTGLPGPGKVKNQTRARTFCSSDPGTEYVPGTGGCP